jgi:hypothetical protein
MTHSHKRKDQNLFEIDKGEERTNETKGKQNDRNGSEENKTEVKDAHASGIGALGRSEEDKIERLGNEDFDDDDVVY